MLASDIDNQIAIIAIAVLYVITCVRIARRVKSATGRSAAVWFFITLVLTAVPAAIVLLRHYRRMKYPSRKQDLPPRRCRHCGRVLTEKNLDDVIDQQTCPHCGMKIDKDHLA